VAAKNNRHGRFGVSAIGRLIGQSLTNVRRRLYRPSDHTSNLTWIVSIELTFSQEQVHASVNPEDDSLELHRRPRPLEDDEYYKEATRARPWKSYIGKPLQFAWLCRNQHDYCDCVMLGFDAYHPSLSLVSVASELHEYQILLAR